LFKLPGLGKGNKEEKEGREKEMEPSFLPKDFMNDAKISSQLVLKLEQKPTTLVDIFECFVHNLKHDPEFKKYCEIFDRCVWRYICLPPRERMQEDWIYAISSNSIVLHMPEMDRCGKVTCEEETSKKLDDIMIHQILRDLVNNNLISERQRSEVPLVVSSFQFYEQFYSRCTVSHQSNLLHQYYKTMLQSALVAIFLPPKKQQIFVYCSFTVCEKRI